MNSVFDLLYGAYVCGEREDDTCGGLLKMEGHTFAIKDPWMPTIYGCLEGYMEVLSIL